MVNRDCKGILKTAYTEYVASRQRPAVRHNHFRLRTGARGNSIASMRVRMTYQQLLTPSLLMSPQSGLAAFDACC
jgi:hypothetical protein